MKTFKDLEFKSHQKGDGLQAALMSFDNGYGVSVVRSYGYEQGLWEVAILYKGSINVLGYQTEQDVTDVMFKVQSFT